MALQCVVLAGGRGTRMRPFTDTRPKSLLPVLGRPFAEWQLRFLASQGLDRITYCIGYAGDQIRDYVGDGHQFGLRVSWVSEGDDLLGTAGALRLAMDQGALEEAFYVLYGDSYLPIDMAPVEAAWRQSRLPALMTVMRNQGRWDRSNVVYADGRVALYDKSRPESQRPRMLWIDYGLSLLARNLIAERIPTGAVADLADLLRALSLEGKLGGYEVSERFYEVGSPDGLGDLEAYLRKDAARTPPAG